MLKENEVHMTIHKVLEDRDKNIKSGELLLLSCLEPTDSSLTGVWQSALQDILIPVEISQAQFYAMIFTMSGILGKQNA